MPDDDTAYPAAMKDIEGCLIASRRGIKRTADSDQPEVLKDAVGVGLSGGGIRSATFCLGLFQGLVKQKLTAKDETPQKTLLSKIDYMSTVSGGGYFGAFYGRLFTREAVATFSDVEEILTVRAANDEEQVPAPGKFPKGKIFRWLRENGRYLAPNGSGDLLLGGAVFMRNWVAVQIVWGTFVLMLFLLAQFIRGLVEVSAANDQWLATCWNGYLKFLVCKMPGGADYIWWSPYAIVAAIAFLLLVVPPAWSYWLVEKPNRQTAGQHWIPPLYGLFAVLALALWGGFLIPRIIRVVLLAEAIGTALWALVNGWRPEFGFRADVGDDIKGLIDKDENTRNRLSRQLKTALVIAGVVLAFIAIDSLAQTGYGAWLSGQLHVKRWAVAVFGPLIGLASFARTIFSSLGGGGANKKISLPTTLLAGVAAFIVGLLVLTTLDFGAYAIAWHLRMPSGPVPKWKTTQKITDANAISATPSKDGGGWVIGPQSKEPPTPAIGCHASPSDLAVLVAALMVAFLFSFLFGWSWPFLNRSTEHAIYTSRLIRAYLGASNPERLKREGRNVTETIDGDDIPQYEYWPRFGWLKTNPGSATPLKDECELFKKGMPIHLVNVTINETVDAPSQIEQHDRKGMGMAIGPAGLSVGVKHHLVLKDGVDHLDTYPKPQPEAQALQSKSSEPFVSVFDFKDNLHPELLTLGNWTGISGAAFSTTLGWRTSISLSLLAGLANIRLSYWWNSGTVVVKPARTTIAGLVSTVFQKVFSVQDFLFDEFLARFHGTARQYWPLSDGGHFENMGGYELIRRRLPMLIIVDAEADPDYTFEGLANLVRKARLDFGAEIRFLTEDQLDQRIHWEFRKYFGTLEQLRRGKWAEEPVADPLGGRKRLSIDPDDEETLSLAHAALADVVYQDGHTPSLLLYIKPTLIGDEPADVRRYHTEHPSFPHETTAEQFFDEAQWESYRRLGEHIADKVFRSRDDRDRSIPPETGKFLPYLLQI